MIELMTTKEVGRILRLSDQSVRELCDQKRLVCIRHNPNGKRLIPKQAVEKYLASLADDAVEGFTPVVIEFDDSERELTERIKRLKRAK